MLQCTCRLTCNTQMDGVCHEHASPDPLVFRVGLFHPTTRTDHLLELVRMQLERLRVPGPVQWIALEASLTAPLAYRQRELFSGGTNHASHNLGQLLDRLSSRLGIRNVVRACLHADAQPEHAYRYLPLTGGSQPPARASRRAARPSARSPKNSRPQSRDQHSLANRRLIRPLLLRSPPLPLTVVAMAPDGPPARLMFGNRSYRVSRCWGPERIDTGWWRGRSVRRDYYRVEIESGHWLWVFHQLTDNTWFLHGTFG